MSIERERFAGGIAVVTGAGAGIGKGFALRLGEAGMHVVVTDVNLDAAEKVAAEIRTKGGKAEALKVDVSIPAELDALAETMFTKHGGVRVLVNNAGIETMGNSWEVSAERWEATLNINVHGVIHGCRAFIPRMLASGEECWIANLASIGAFAQGYTMNAYTVTKHAVEAFTECLYLELEQIKAPIHVSSIIPGMIRTDIFNGDAGQGEPCDATVHRKGLRDLAAIHGMDIDVGCKIFVEKMARGEFWIDSQPEMTKAMVDARIEFLQRKGAPHISQQTREMFKD
jgi:NAD(P)-dependent dehydrogenase (short-subunit alcohol dehydrogenase family)